MTTAARTAKIGNFIRFQGQYVDVETGFHYNRYHYYDPAVGRYVSKDPIGLVGGVNEYQYAPNAISWTDPFGRERRAIEMGSVVGEGYEKGGARLRNYHSTNGYSEKYAR